mmetsp:Transcript_21705/g.19233  ORF Transcript_21705/g.19233 Transcript_21705/m.19233 type:complete len:90 (-) Transcript_21705:29-298(-)
MKKREDKEKFTNQVTLDEEKLEVTKKDNKTESRKNIKIKKSANLLKMPTANKRLAQMTKKTKKPFSKTPKDRRLTQIYNISSFPSQDLS